MKKLLSLSVLAMLLSVASYALDPMFPTSGTVCIGSSFFITDSLSPGGTWSSSDPAIGSIGVSTGILTGITSGTVTITYTLGGSYVTGDFTVNPLPAAITGGGSALCVGATMTLSDATPGGTWESYEPYTASIGSTSGVVNGVHGGTAYILYTAGGCSATIFVTVDATSAGRIVPMANVCLGSTYAYIDTGSLGGTWTSTAPAIATIGVSSGIASGLALGTTIISYTTTGSCGTSVVTSTLNVINTTTAGMVYGTSAITIGASPGTLSSTISGGTWTSGAPGVATIDAATGVYTAVSAGVAPITYTVVGCGGVAYAYYMVTVNALDGISGTVNFGSGPLYHNVKVWLITYNPATHDLEAADSALYYCSGTSFYYQFTGLATDSFRIKAAPDDTVGTTYGYMPTYHTSQFYWHDADVVYHTAGTDDIHKDINMSYGTVVAGPGFISGDVLTGANRGTSGGAPSKHVCMYLVNAATGNLVLKTYTDNAGHYSFTNLPVGQTYVVFPDSMNFATIAYTGINLTTANPGKTSISFTQHTLSHTITPAPSAVDLVKTTETSVFTFPNPANNKVVVQWNARNTEAGHIVITDATGRVAYKADITLSAGAGSHQVDVSSFVSGLYLVTVNSASVTYAGKVSVVH